MRKITSALAGVILSLTALQLNAQQTYHRCSSMEYLSAQQQLDPNLAAKMQQVEQFTQQYVQANQHNASRSLVTIPVVFHVLYNTTAQNISDAQIQAQINQLNLDYARLNTDASSTPSAFSALAANTNVQFCLAQRDPSGNASTGIVRKSTTSTSFTTNDNAKHSSTGGDDAWPAGSYLNIWSCNLGGGLLGYAQFPGGAASTDGVVLLYSSIGSMLTPGTASPYNFGRTATHEVGHWLNLYHIWGDDSGACTGSDNVNDTPNQAAENYGCPAYPHTDACAAASPGVMFMNYMDYTDDGCMNMFTQGQTARMNALFAGGGARVSLLSSLGCTPPTATACNVSSSLTTSAITTTTATFTWSAVSGAASYKLQYRVVGAATWTSATATTTSYAVSGLTAATNYEWQVQTVCSSGSSAFSASATFTTASGTTTTCSDVYEPNESRTAAKTIATNTNITGLIATATDNDYFKFTTTSPNTNIRITVSNLPADYDVRLYNSSGSQLAISQNSGTTSELIKRNTTTAATYYVRVYGYGGVYNASSCYTLNVTVGSTAFRTEDETIDATAKETIADAEAQIKLYPNPATDNVTIEYLSNVEGKVIMNVYNIAGQKVVSNETSSVQGLNVQTINTNALSNGVYVFEIENNGVITRQRFNVAK